VTWQVQTAKQRFSELVERAVTEGPQIVTKHGRETVVVLDVAEYRRLKGVTMSFKELLLAIPKGDPLEIERSKDTGRDVERQLGL
jgi:prevent-host-death family protein